MLYMFSPTTCMYSVKSMTGSMLLQKIYFISFQKLHLAAKAIQAFWRSYYTRKKLSTAQKAMANFQRSFR